MDFSQLVQAGGTAKFIWLTLLFAGVLLWAFWPKRRDKLKDDAQGPRADGDDGP